MVRAWLAGVALGRGHRPVGRRGRPAAGGRAGRAGRPGAGGAARPGRRARRGRRGRWPPPPGRWACALDPGGPGCGGARAVAAGDGVCRCRGPTSRWSTPPSPAGGGGGGRRAGPAGRGAAGGGADGYATLYPYGLSVRLSAVDDRTAGDTARLLTGRCAADAGRVPARDRSGAAGPGRAPRRPRPGRRRGAERPRRTTRRAGLAGAEETMDVQSRYAALIRSILEPGEVEVVVLG